MRALRRTHGRDARATLPARLCGADCIRFRKGTETLSRYLAGDPEASDQQVVTQTVSLRFGLTA